MKHTAGVVSIIALALAAGLGCSGGQDASPPEATGEVSSDPILNQVPGKIVAGVMPLSFRVTPSGAATVSIPLVVPPGTAGVEPKLSLEYSSQGGPGIAGQGWSLSGLSAIGRCGKTLAVDGVSGSVNLDANDAFCMDGARLLYVGPVTDASGPAWEFRSEVESFSRIWAVGGTLDNPTMWKVRTKAGQSLRFGDGDNSTSVSIPRFLTRRIRVWGLHTLQDAVGNGMTIQYQTPDLALEQMYPVRIAYTHNAKVAGQVGDAQRVDFVYESQPTSTMFMGGAVVGNNVRLKAVRTFVNQTQMVREYRLSYDKSSSTARSRLRSVQDCNNDNECMLGDTFHYEDTPLALDAPAPWGTGHDKDERVGDFNGDGRADVLILRGVSGALSAFVGLSGGTSFSAPAAWAAGLGTDSKHIASADMNLDNRTDLVRFTSTGAEIWMSTGTAFSKTWSATFPFIADPSRMTVEDIDGDKRIDLLVFTKDNRVMAARNNGAGFDAPFEWIGPNVPGSKALGNLEMARHKLTDINGDGKVDLLEFGAVGNPVDVGAWIDGQYMLAATGLPDAMSSNFVADMNGDGHPDLITLNDTTKVWYSKGDGRFTPPTSYGPGYSRNDLLADLNGDGKADLIRIGRGFQAKVALALPSGANVFFPYMASTIVSGTDLSGAALPTTTSTYTYDPTARELTQSVVETAERRTTTTNTYEPADKTNWILFRWPIRRRHQDD